MSRRPKNNTETVRKRYDRNAFVYNLMEWPLERVRLGRWRTRLTHAVAGPRALEVGIGTGKNLSYYPFGVSITAIDFSRKMLAKAERKSERQARQVELLHMDVEHLNFADASFDTVFATFVFCSVPDPVQGLKELRRVCKPDGKLLLLEHMRPDNILLGLLFDAFNTDQ